MFGIGYGPDNNENTEFGSLQQASGFATSVGEHDLSDSSDFLDAVISGDSSKISQVLAPQIGAAKTRAQQEKNTMAQFGDRGGGTGAAAANIDESTNSDITGMVGNLTGSAASQLGSMGESSLGMGMSGTEAGFGEATTLHQQHLDQLNDIFKSSAQVAESGFGMIPGGPGSFGDVASNMAGSVD